MQFCCLYSTNGTVINKLKVVKKQTCPLQTGDVIYLVYRKNEPEHSKRKGMNRVDTWVVLDGEVLLQVGSVVERESAEAGISLRNVSVTYTFFVVDVDSWCDSCLLKNGNIDLNSLSPSYSPEIPPKS